MSCRRVRREVLEIVRFGEIGPGSSPHLEHLSRCGGCRDEVGFDRALVAQLRRALAARVDPVTPPSRAWYAILRETQRPEPRRSVWTWSSALVGRLRTATAMAGTGLALLVALNMEVIPVSVPAPRDAGRPDEVALQQVPRMPTGRTTLVALANLANERGAEAASRPDPERALMQADARVSARAPLATDAAAHPSEEEAPGPAVLIVKPLQTPERDDGGGSGARAPLELDGVPRETVEVSPGEPS